MNIRQLIEELQKLDPTIHVYVDDWGCDVTENALVIAWNYALIEREKDNKESERLRQLSIKAANDVRKAETDKGTPAEEIERLAAIAGNAVYKTEDEPDSQV